MPVVATAVFIVAKALPLYNRPKMYKIAIVIPAESKNFGNAFKKLILKSGVSTFLLAKVSQLNMNPLKTM